MPDSILITKTVCSNCKAVKKRLASKSIEVRELNADTDDEAAKYASEHGLLSVPAIIDNGNVYRTMQEILDWIRSK